jgi:hypothetical protein
MTNISNTGTCTEKTTETLFAAIPGARVTVRPYAGVDLMKTYELCAIRELAGKPTSWTEITYDDDFY